MELLTTLLNTGLSLVVFIIIIAILVAVHEVGHFIAAKLVGIKVNEFAIGFGKTLFSRQYGETLYRINLIPLGGFVSLEGEVGSENDEASAGRSYQDKPWLAKVFVLTAGVGMNMVLAFFVFFFYLQIVGFSVRLPVVTDYEFIGVDEYTMSFAVSEVLEGSPAQGKLFAGDLINTINGEDLTSSDGFLALLQEYAGTTAEVAFTRIKESGEVNEQVILIDLPVPETENGPILKVRFYPYLFTLEYDQNFSAAISHSFNMLGYQLKYLGEQIQISVDQRNAGIVGEQVGSIVAVGVVINDLVDSQQFQELLNLTGLISLSLALVNILPIPALDGGHVVLVTIEAITRRKVPSRIADRINKVGFILLLMLGLLIIFKDVVQFELLDRIKTFIGAVLGS